MRARLSTWLMAMVSVTLVGVMLQLAYTYWRRAQPFEPPRKGPEQATVPEELNTAELKILNFYAPNPRPSAGQPFTVCYGVLNATAVELDPPLAEVAPSLSRCVEVKVQKDTKVTLRATGKNGEKVEALLVVPGR